MKKESRILTGAREALAIARDEMPVESYAVHVPEAVDVKSIRAKLKMTQAQFAQAFGLKLATLRQWERGGRTPEGPARAYLRVIDHAPDVVRTALQPA